MQVEPPHSPVIFNYVIDNFDNHDVICDNKTATHLFQLVCTLMD